MHINVCQKNLNRKFIDMKNAGYKLIFLNISKAVCEELSITIINNIKNIDDGKKWKCFYFFEDANDPLTKIDIDINALFKETFKNKLKNYMGKHPKPHSSSSVYLSAYVDIKKFRHLYTKPT